MVKKPSVDTKQVYLYQDRTEMREMMETTAPMDNTAHLGEMGKTVYQLPSARPLQRMGQMDLQENGA